MVVENLSSGWPPVHGKKSRETEALVSYALRAWKPEEVVLHFDEQVGAGGGTSSTYGLGTLSFFCAGTALASSELRSRMGGLRRIGLGGNRSGGLGIASFCGEAALPAKLVDGLAVSSCDCAWV